MNRGERPETIFKDDPNRERFLQTPGQTCEQTVWQIHAYYR